MISALYIIFYVAYVVLMTMAFPHWLLFVVFLITGLAVALLVILLLILALFPVFKHTDYQNKFKGYMIKSISHFLVSFILNVDVEVIGADLIPKTGNIVLYANHKSMADPFLVLEAMNRPLSFTPKTGIYKIPFVRNLLNYIGCFPIDRANNRNTAKELVKAIDRVKKGLAMLVFPEGGIKDRDDDTMKEMRAGAYKIAMKSESALVPITIIGASEIHKKSPWRKSKIKLIIHPVIPYESYKDQSTHEIAENVFQIINESL